MLSSVFVENFRGIGLGELGGFSQVNLLVGPNNSGKSALLEALYCMGCTVPSSNPGTSILRTSQADVFNRWAVQHIRERHLLPDESSPHRPEDYQRMAYDPMRQAWFWKPTFAQYLVGSAFSPDSGEEIDEWEHAQAFRECLKGHPFFDIGNPNLTHYRAPFAMCTWRGSAYPQADRVLFFGADWINRRTPISFVRKFYQVEGGQHTLNTCVTRLLGAKEQWVASFLPDESEANHARIWLQSPDKASLPLDSFGDGTRSAVKFLVPLIYLEKVAKSASPGLVLWEEPELFQNPRTLEMLVKETIQLIRGRPVQLFIATHSLELIALWVHWSAELLGTEALKAFRLELRDGTLVSSPFAHANLEAWLSAGRDPRVWGASSGPLQFALEGGEQDA